MVMQPLPQPHELIALFEGDPEYPYTDADKRAGTETDWEKSWPYTRLIFRLARNGRSVSFDVEPGYEQVRLKIVEQGSETVDLLLRRVVGMGIAITNGRELLRLDFGDSFRGGSLWLRLKPDISIGWEVGEP